MSLLGNLFRSKKPKPQPQVKKRSANKVNKKRNVDIKEDIRNYTQDLIPIKSIKNGVIETTDGRYVKIIEVEPINFLLRNPQDQYNIVATFASWFKISNTKIQIKSLSRRADSREHIENFLKDLEGETGRGIHNLAKAYTKLVQQVGSEDALQRRFFIIFEYERIPGMPNTGKYNNIINGLNMTAANAKYYLKQCGNNVVDVHPNKEDYYIQELLYTFFNKRSSVNESFQSRVDRVIKDSMEREGRKLGDPIIDIPPVDFIAPRGIDLTHPDFFIMDGLYYSFLYITSDGYPDAVIPGWTSMLINAGDGVDVDIFLTKLDKEKVKNDLSRRINWNVTSGAISKVSDQNYEQLQNMMRSGVYIKQGLAANDEIFDMNIIITLSAPRIDELEAKKMQLKTYLSSMDIMTDEGYLLQENLLRTVMPLVDIDEVVYRRSRRNVLTLGAASTYLFTAFEIFDETGVLLGINTNNNSLCLIDLFNSQVYKNANMTIIGTTGSGKTFTLQLMAMRMRMRGIDVFIIAPLKGIEFKRACDYIGGSYIKIAPGSPHCINIMEIREVDEIDSDLIDGYDESGDSNSLLAQKVQQLNVFFELLIDDMDEVESQLMDEAIMKTYADKGITHDNDSIYNPDGSIKTMPILGDLHANLTNRPETQRLAILVNRFVSGSAKSFNNQTNVNLDNKYIVMDISDTQDKLLPVSMFIALDYCWDKIKQDRTKKKMIFIDETWLLISTSNEHAAEFVLEIFKIIRGYGGGAVAATQDLSDFFALEDGKYGRGIINNSMTKIILGLEEDEAKMVQATLNLDNSEVKNITQYGRGEALLIANNNRVPIRVKASLPEELLITTDRSQLAEMAELKKRGIDPIEYAVNNL